MKPMTPMAPMAPMKPMEPMQPQSAWWPKDLGDHPNSSGSQNQMRYAYFGDARRLAVDNGGVIKVYDTGPHQIQGFSQQQSGSGSLRFASAEGTIDLASLPTIS
ncbi:hypothetical protein BH11PSE8_BH11PSE8_43970 [soil metagenome]